jgi:proteasome lid subunit RPN8/RPN11
MDDLATVCVYTTRSDAEIVRARLLSDGIEALVIADDEGGLNPGFYSHYGVRVVVAANDLPRARKILGLEAMIVEGGVIAEMIEHARRWAPNEACGLVAGCNGIVVRAYALSNADPGPDRFTLDPSEQFGAIQDAEARGWAIVGSFHSHPAGEPIPSRADLEGGGDPGWVNFIVGVEMGAIAVRAYRYRDGAATAIEIERR